MPKLDSDAISEELRRAFTLLFANAGVRVAPDALDAAVAIAVAAVCRAANPYDADGACLYCEAHAIGPHAPACVCAIGDGADG